MRWAGQSGASTAKWKNAFYFLRDRQMPFFLWTPPPRHLWNNYSTSHFRAQLTAYDLYTYRPLVSVLSTRGASCFCVDEARRLVFVANKKRLQVGVGGHTVSTVRYVYINVIQVISFVSTGTSLSRHDTLISFCFSAFRRESFRREWVRDWRSS